MRSFKFTIEEKNGLHARPAGMISSESKKFKSQITIKNGEKEADGKRLLSVMALGARLGSTLEFIIDGEDEEIAEAAIRSVLERIL